MKHFEPIIWDSSFETGVSEIDEQHKILVDTLNTAGITLAVDYDNSSLEQIVNDLLSYSQYHFETEEELMLEYEYTSELETEHLKQHRDFCATVISVSNDIHTGKAMPADDLLQFLKDWLTNHILNTDKKLGAFIVEKRK